MEKQLQQVRQLFAYDDYIHGIETDLENKIVDLHTTIDWGLGLTEEQYEQVERLLETTIEKPHYTISFSYDVSGFDYWVNIMGEDNYIHITIELKDTFDFNKYETLEMDQEIWKVLDQFYSIV
ncbi:MAG: hypothetical protein ACRCVU_05035 [Flavobacterium sp.]